MKHNKRLISLLLVFVLLVSVNIYTYANSTENFEARKLSEWNIVVGVNGDLMLDEKFTVEQLMTVIARLLGKENEALNFSREPVFTDLTRDHWSSPYFGWAKANGYIKGKPDGTVGYADNVNGQRLATFMLRVLGYTNVNYDEAFEIASFKGLLDTVAILPTTEVIRGDVCKIIYRTMFTTTSDGTTIVKKLGLDTNEKIEEQAPAPAQTPAPTNEPETPARTDSELPATTVYRLVNKSVVLITAYADSEVLSTGSGVIISNSGLITMSLKEQQVLR